MKTKYTLIPAAVAAAVALNMTAPSAEARYDDLGRYAHRIDDIAQELRDEFRIHFRHSSAYGQLRSDIAEVLRKVHHIDDLSLQYHPSLCRIKAELASLDRLVHHMRDVVDRAESGCHRRHVYGDTRYVHRLLSSLDRSVQSMEEAVTRMGHRGRHDDHRDRYDDRRDRHGRDYGGSHHSSSDRVFRFVIEGGRHR